MNYRPEIDGLRAIAVLSVIFYHFFPNIFSGGFVGVDIFFVISGFLITKNVKYATENKQFSLVEFYSNRIIRLFPALILVILFSLAIGYLILLEDEFIKLSHHAIGGAFFVPNLVFILETGYFNQESITKPLLHLWSLGIEEQFYLLFPLIFIFLPYCKETLFIFFCFLISFFYCMSLTVNDQVIAFYSPFSRAWELLAGALIALGEEKRIDYKLKTFVS